MSSPDAAFHSVELGYCNRTEEGVLGVTPILTFPHRGLTRGANPLSLRERARVRVKHLSPPSGKGLPTNPLSLRERARVRVK